jgi:hypothetical protein
MTGNDIRWAADHRQRSAQRIEIASVIVVLRPELGATNPLGPEDSIKVCEQARNADIQLIKLCALLKGKTNLRAQNRQQCCRETSGATFPRLLCLSLTEQLGANDPAPKACLIKSSSLKDRLWQE